MTDFEIVRVRAEHVEQVLPLMRAYCDFYEAHPSRDALRGICDALVADPQHAGLQLLARSDPSTALGFATLFWTFSTLNAGPIGLMNDLYVAPAARGHGIGTALIDACAGECVHYGMSGMEWYTATDNTRAQSVYDHTGATRSEWINYHLPVS